MCHLFPECHRLQVHHLVDPQMQEETSAQPLRQRKLSTAKEL